MSEKSIKMIKEFQRKNSTKKYQLALSSPMGVEPQKYEIYNSQIEAQELCKKYNEQLNNPYARWVVLER